MDICRNILLVKMPRNVEPIFAVNFLLIFEVSFSKSCIYMTVSLNYSVVAHLSVNLSSGL